MLLNFARGGAAINVLARQAGARVVVVDMGVRVALPALPEIRCAPHRRRHAQLHARAGDDARSRRSRAIEAGIAVADELAADGIDAARDRRHGDRQHHLGERARPRRSPARRPTRSSGRGTGLDDAGVRAQDRGGPARARAAPPRPRRRRSARSPQLGGFEIAGLAGVALGAAAARVPVIVDGFICGAAALAAARIAPRRRGVADRFAPLGRGRPSRGVEGARPAAAAGSGPAARRRHRRGAGDEPRRRRAARSCARWRPSRRRA